MKEGKSNWGRVAVVMTVAQKLALETDDKEKIAKSLTSIIATNMPEGGWPHLTKQYKRKPMTKQFSKYIFVTVGIVIGLYTIFILVART